MVPLNTPLNTGDVIEIVTSNAGKGPSRDWLKFVVSSQAKAKIRAFFKKERAGENIKLGRDMIEKESKRKGFDWNLLASMDAEVDEILKRYSLSSLDDLYAAIGYGALKTGQVLFKLIDKYRKAQALNQKVESLLAPQETTTQIKPTKKKSSSGVLIEGYGDFMVKLARCCNPVPGDEIVGYAMRGAGVSIHRKDCPNVKGMESQRLMNASWANTDNSVFQAKLLIECVDRTGLATSILPMISNQGIYMTSVDMRVNKGVAIINITLEIRSADELDYIINKIESHPDTISIKRG
jgi:GTP pyrophosphokinase